MSARKRAFAKIEIDPSQTKITHYFPKTDKFKHDFNLTIATKKKACRQIILAPEIIATIDLNSSDDEFQVSRPSISPKLKRINKRKKRATKKLVAKPTESTSLQSETNVNVVNPAELVEAILDIDILENILNIGEQSQNNTISCKNEIGIELNDLHAISSQSSNTDIIHSKQNIVISQFPRITDKICLNKPKILINAPEQSKAIILQTNTVDLFTADDITQSSEITKIIPESQKNTAPVAKDKDLYLENFTTCNKENSPEICNMITDELENSNLPKSEPKSEPADNSIDISEVEVPSPVLNSTIIKDYIAVNETENIHDVLVELHHALDRIENTAVIAPDSPYYKMFFLRKVVRNVVENFDMLRLLRDVERKTLVTFLHMDTKYQYFCFRLFTRLPKWYNMYKLIETIKLDMGPKEISEMYACLQENGFIQTDYSKESISTLLHMLERSALTRIHNNFKIKRSKSTTKESIIDSLIACCNSQTTLSLHYRSDQVLYKLISVEMGPCAKLDNNFYTTLSRIHVLNSFTNSDLGKVSDLYFFMAQIERGDVILPIYDVESAVGNIFPRRQDFLLYSKAAEYKNQFVLKMEKTGKSRDWKSIKNICDFAFAELQQFLKENSHQNNSDLMNRFTAGYKYASILNEASKHLTKLYSEDVENWLNLLLQQNDFCQKCRGLWYDRLALIKSSYRKEPDEAAIMVLKGLNDVFVSESGRRDILNRALGLLKRKTNKVRDDLLVSIKSKIPNCFEKKYSIRNIQGKQQPGNQGKCYFLENDGEHRTYYTVEDYSIKHYITDLNFTDGIHCEGSLFSTFFTVLFWDIIYEEYIPGTFLNNLQVYPLDYFCKDFRANREDAIDGRLEQIGRVWSVECFERTIRENFDQHKHRRCGIASNLLESGQQLVTIAKCIGRENLAIVMDRFVGNIGDMCAGLPDLFVWNSVTCKCKFVEVKSEKDILSMKQILWLNFLISANLDAEVCNVLPSINASHVPVSKRATVE